MKILLIQHLYFLNGSGGTEKICTFLANGFDGLGHEVEIATCQNIKGRPVFPLNTRVKVTNIFSENIHQTKLKPLFNYKGLNPIQWIRYKVNKKLAKKANKDLLKEMGGAEGLFKNNLRLRAKAWKNYIESRKPDIIITMSVSSVLEITFENDYHIPIVNSVNGRPDYDYSDILGYRSPFEMDLLKNAYKSLAGIQILFESYREFLPQTFQGKISVIPNPVPQFDDGEIVKHDGSKHKYKIVNIATLANHCKQQLLAIEAFAAIEKKHPEWELHFWGEGEDLNFLDDKIKKLHLQDKVFLNGFINNPVSKLQESDLFIFPSKYEGFPLALTEAMSAGLPALGFSTCSGVNELIIHNISGFLAKDINELKLYLEKLIENVNLRSEMGKNGHFQMMKFNSEKILNQWILFLNDCK